MTFAELLECLQTRGQSVTLTWAEDNDLWECSWITGGVRYTGFSHYPEQAVREAWRQGRLAQE